jgi:hypothetical protein
MKRKKLKMHRDTLRVLMEHEQRAMVGGVITHSASGNGCATSCWCVSDFVSDCGPC